MKLTSMGFSLKIYSVLNLQERDMQLEKHLIPLIRVLLNEGFNVYSQNDQDKELAYII